MKEKEEVKKQRKEPYHFSPAQMQLIEEYMDCSMTKLKTLCRTIWLKDTLDQKYYDDLYDDAMTVLMETVESYNPEHEKKHLLIHFLWEILNDPIWNGEEIISNVAFDAIYL